jgi:hypothetical protein
MRALEMILPRLEKMVELASAPEVASSPAALARLREDYRYMASVSMSLLPHLEPELIDLPPALPLDAEVAERIAFRMSLVKRTNRLSRAVGAYLAGRASGEEDQRRQGYAGSADATATGTVPGTGEAAAASE